MKKYFMLLIFCLFLAGCGKDYKTYSLEEKKEMIKEAVIENRQGNREKMDKLDKLVKKLEEAARNGDKEAVAELKEWHETASLIEGSY
ncbi:hypothetical protein [Fusobacterium sp.]|jgi:hypothetical protein|uniref:Lipoprotein n=1 Tax=Fusobacterium nucleatum TaxID=851 RepID=A0A323U114_FUSNU|nr:MULTISPECIES: hypothetical protein [Fusobacterium]PCR83909.1 hypothetical protein CQA79_12680 [Fusobacterium nucleatum]PZA05110.1 hypothetical protein DNF10_02220 [Fusobacterium nucleatum]QJX51661.1 hypothetical protein HOO60_12255 [Fusobacterium nucleatum]HCE32578.1 hypothetical protein [Fusobacterium sp.]